MAPNAELVEWVDTAPGVAMNPDRHYGLQCVDAVDQYALDIFGVPWQDSIGGVQGAKQILDSASDDYWTRTNNDPANDALLPSFGDVLVYGGTAANPWGHTCICISADKNGCWVIQQDGFAAPLIFVDGAWYSNKPAHKAYLPHWGPGTGLLTGWLTPRPEKIVGYKPPPLVDLGEKLLGYQRATQKVNQVGYRKGPSSSAELIRWLEPDSIYDFKGFVRKDGDVWFVGRYTEGFAWRGGFVDEGTHDLPDLTEQYFPTKPLPIPAPPVADVPPVVAPLADMLNFVDVSQHQDGATLQSMPGDFIAIKASEGVGWEDPSLGSNVAEARVKGEPIVFYHLARPMAQDGNTAEAEAQSFLKAIKPYLKLGDRVALDWEMENQNLTEWAEHWLDLVSVSLDTVAVIYLNSNGINGGDWAKVEVKFPLWFAGYGTNPVQEGFSPRPKPSDVSWASGIWAWQYSSKGRLPGYSGDLDLNVFYGTMATFNQGAVKRLSSPSIPDPVPTPAPAPVNTDASVLTRFFQWLIDLFIKSGR